MFMDPVLLHPDFDNPTLYIKYHWWGTFLSLLEKFGTNKRFHLSIYIGAVRMGLSRLELFLLYYFFFLSHNTFLETILFYTYEGMKTSFLSKESWVKRLYIDQNRWKSTKPFIIFMCLKLFKEISYWTNGYHS